MFSRTIVRGLRAPAQQQAQQFRAAFAAQHRGLASNSHGGSKKPSSSSRPINPPPAKSPATPKPSVNPASPTQPSTSSSAAANVAADASKPITPEAETSSMSAEAPEEPARPLPDLTKGIPSTLDFEMAGQSAQSAGRSAASGLNLTEDPSFEGSGKPKGELPASAYVSSSEKRRLKMANYMYAAMGLGVVGAAIYFGRDWASDEESSKHASDAPSGYSPALWWNRAKARLGDQLNYYKEPAFQKLLPDPDPMFERPYTLVLSLEDLLIHSEWTRENGWRLAKRPGVDYFLRYLSQYYELVLFTSIPWSIAEPIVGKLDPFRIITWPLFREATKYENGEYVKDLSYLNRDLSKVIMIDTVPAHAKANPENAIILPKWTGDPKDKELVSLIPFLEYIHTMNTPDVRIALKSFDGKHIPTEFAKREAIARERFNEELAKQKKRPAAGASFLSKALGLKPQPVYEGEQSLSDAIAQGKMLQDIARERGQRNYEMLEQQIRENGEQWLKEEAANQEKAKEEGMRAMRSTITGVFGTPQNPSS